jgi:hypothetical protein
LPTEEELSDLIAEMKAIKAIPPVVGRVQFPLPQPQPTSPLRGDVVPITFALYRFARSGHAPAAVQKLYKTFGAYHVKPHRGSRGLIWNNRSFWWCPKGYYRPGFTRGPRRPLQHYIWEAHHGRAMPPMHEIFFRDRDRHNFAIDNLELLSKADLHKRTIELGEVTQISREQRMEIAGKRWMRSARRGTALLLENFNQSETSTHKNNGHSPTLEFLAQRREVINNGPTDATTRSRDAARARDRGAAQTLKAA